jgi:hypothetical protein
MIFFLSKEGVYLALSIQPQYWQLRSKWIQKPTIFSKASKEQQLSIQEDSQGGIWVLSPLDGLFLFEKANNTFEKKRSIEQGNIFVDTSKIIS